MSTASTPSQEFREWSIAAVHLLQGPIYSDEAREWEIILRSRSQLESYLARLGLLLIVDDADGYAYVRQWTDDECPAGAEHMPKLMRRATIGYGPTLLAVLLREALRVFEESDFHNERCVVDADAIMDQWKAFFKTASDEAKQQSEFLSAMRKLEAVGFVRQFSDKPLSWEIRRILKARLPVAELEILRNRLLQEAARRGNAEPTEGGDERS